ncbi:MAG TPA: hypothetical protein VK656_03240 [Candidatus Acidoferrum sp.]|nr:hypothetical protein [Candidatus Acidoferrum sp.]
MTHGRDMSCHRWPDPPLQVLAIAAFLAIAVLYHFGPGSGGRIQTRP